LVALAAGDEAAPSLRGGRPVAEAIGNDTTSAADETHAAVAGFDFAVAPFNDSDSMAQDLADMMGLARNLSKANVSEGEAEDSLESILLMRGGWAQGGDKVWGNGRGTESISRRNVGYYNKGMYAARAHCGGPGCALITNPMGHRSVGVFHIHFVHYHGYGARLHKKLESKVCGTHGWRRGGLPCAGKAAYYPGFPGVFSAAMGGGGIGSASVVAWPASCGGRGTIVQLAYGCSLEHKIRGDFKRGFR